MKRANLIGGACWLAAAVGLSAAGLWGFSEEPPSNPPKPSQTASQSPDESRIPSTKPSKPSATADSPMPTPTPSPTLTPTTVMGEFTVDYGAAAYRTTNIGRAAELMNGTVVQPGEVWSMNDTVGERTPENGFVRGAIIRDGRYSAEYGGGISALATTMFNAAFFAGLEFKEYGAHSFYIERYPEGREATVAWGWLDLKWKNNTDHAVTISTENTATAVTVKLLGENKWDDVQSVTGPRTNVIQPETRYLDSPDCLPQTPYTGFDVNVRRVFIAGGEKVKREWFHTKYKPRDRVICSDDYGGHTP